MADPMFRFTKFNISKNAFDSWVAWFQKLGIKCEVRGVKGSYSLWREGKESIYGQEEGAE